MALRGANPVHTAPMRHQAVADRSPTDDDDLLTNQWLAEPSQGSLAPLARSTEVDSEEADDLHPVAPHSEAARHFAGLPKLGAGEFARSMLGGFAVAAACIAVLHFGGSLSGRDSPASALAATTPRASAAPLITAQGPTIVDERDQQVAAPSASAPASEFDVDAYFLADESDIEMASHVEVVPLMTPIRTSGLSSVAPETEIGSGAGFAEVEYAGTDDLRRGKVRRRRGMNVPTLRFPSVRD